MIGAPTPRLARGAQDVMAGPGELAGLMRGFDWTSTPLGRPDRWPQSLKTAVRIMLTSRQPIWIGWGRELTFLYNDAYRSIIGGKHPWALGKPTSDVWSEIWHDIGPMLDSAMGGTEGTYVEEQLLIMERNGYPEETYYTFSYSPIPDDDGTPGGIICANTEDTQRVFGERQLALLRDIAAKTAGAQSRHDACRLSAEAIGANPRDVPFAAIYMGEEGSDALRLAATSGIDAGHRLAPDRIGPGDMLWPDMSAGFDHPQLLDLHGQGALDVPSGAWDRQPSSAALLPIPASGGVGMLLVGLSPVRLLNADYRDFLSLVAGQIGTAIATAEAYERERSRAEALAEIDRAKTMFFSNVSHEFRTPLTLMLGPLEELAQEDTPLDAESRALAEVAHRNGLRLLRLVNSLLDFARLEAGRVEARFEPVDLAALTADLASNFRAACDRAGLSLDVDCPSLGVPSYVDRDMWEKIVLNLLSNAFKYTLAGGIRVALSARSQHEIVLKVEDSGVGIPAEELPRLFDRFHRIEGQRGRTQEGSGIGLALVHELVRLHGGTITVESEVGRGSSFTVQLPIGAAHLPADRIMEGASPSDQAIRPRAFVEEAMRWLPEAAGDYAQEAATLDREAMREGGRIVVADDNADMRDYVRRLLTPLGHRLELVADGEAALAAIRRERPELVLSDVMMPRLDGFGLLAAIRDDRDLRDLPVILLSARAGEESRIEGLEAGADDYLTKPFAGRELVARVSSNLTAARLRRQMAEEIRGSELRLRGLFEQAPGFVAILNGPEHVFEFANASYMALFGKRNFVGRPVREVLPDAAGQGFFEKLDQVFATGERFVAEGMPLRLKDPDSGRIRDFVLDFIYEPVRDKSGAVTGIFVEGSDVSERMRAESALREESRTLDTLNRSGASLAGELDVERIVQMVTDAGVELTGAGFGAFFYNVPDGQGGSYMLYTLSGVDREAFRDFPMPRNTAVFAPTFEGTEVVRSDDILEDPRYGRNAPWRGMPEGHLPVRSYLAVPVASRNGDVLGGLFFGHPEPGRFDARHERLMVGIAAQASIAIDNTRLYEAGKREIDERRRAEEELRELNDTLERRVAEAVAEREIAAEALRQAQKMEVVGQLTGGVAHDFNNLLTIITGNMDMVRRSLDRGDEERVRRAIDNAQKGAERAASLTQRLLAFSRRQPLAPKPIDVDRLVSNMSDLLNRALGETIRLEIVTTPGLWRIEADPNQLENCLLNLAVNARDAMPDGGKLTIETANARLDESYSAAHAEVAPGNYVVIAVSDTGMGMSRETLSRVFEPFFTTKEVGRGTGLGLSMVYGFVKQSGGHVKIYSEEGAGTTIKIYLPRLMREAAGEEEPTDVAAPGQGQSETILVAEDDDDVRAYTIEILRELGYQVLAAHDGAAALRLIAREDLAIDLLFTDVVMPHMSGRELVERAREIRPDLKVLYTSGYTRNAIVHNGRLDAGVEMIAKPFTYQALSARVRDILDAGASGRVLIVESDPRTRMMVSEALSGAGLAVDEAVTAAEALNKLRASAGSYSALILDGELDDGRGLALAEEIRAMRQDLPMLIVARPVVPIAPRFDGDRRTATLARPFAAETLVEALRALGVRCRDRSDTSL
ncbi:response regulator [Flavisphingomonas formosensis]|uniref:response regulator n=1 Tax=Flavisphingomonas formosensis TaxID=861534 RepID=UPI0012FACE3F|nr:response regulator [Sphingomonas formosensis]